MISFMEKFGSRRSSHDKPSNPALLYIFRNLQTRNAEKSLPSIDPLHRPKNANDRQLQRCDYSNGKIGESSLLDAITKYKSCFSYLN